MERKKICAEMREMHFSINRFDSKIVYEKNKKIYMET